MSEDFIYRHVVVETVQPFLSVSLSNWNHKQNVCQWRLGSDSEQDFS